MRKNDEHILVRGVACACRADLDIKTRKVKLLHACRLHTVAFHGRGCYVHDPVWFERLSHELRRLRAELDDAKRSRDDAIGRYVNSIRA